MLIRFEVNISEKLGNFRKTSGFFFKKNQDIITDQVVLQSIVLLKHFLNMSSFMRGKALASLLNYLPHAPSHLKETVFREQFLRFK